MSIYIALVTLEDPDIFGTIYTAIKNANNPSSITIGIAAAVEQPFFDQLKELNDFTQVTIKKFDPIDAKGVGRGRNLSRFAYNGERYILQVDPHTYFEKGWDETLISLYNESIGKTKNNKTILTSYLGSYTIKDSKAFIIDRRSRYCVYTSAQWSSFMRLQYWTSLPLNEFPTKINMDEGRFFPANKIGGGFIFASNYFAEFSGLPKSVIYLEEEVIQAINLLENGWSLVHPDVDLPITHRYDDAEKVNRQNGKSLFWDNPIMPECLVTENMYNFIKEYPDKCNRYADHTQYDLATGLVKPFYIPKNFGY